MKAKRFLAVLMVLAMVIVLYPVVAAAAVPITHDISTGPITIGDDGIYIITGTTTSNYIRVSAGASPDITLEKVNISSGGCAFLIENDSSGNVDLTLVGANTLISAANFAGLQKNGNNEIVGTLTIEGTGSLTATGGMWSAGIGGGDLGSGRNIIINGGTINSAGGAQGAGIGGGFLGTGSDIIINGGTVNATGGENGAGIGGGRQEVGSKITINGGTVNANGGEYGAGIGGGYARAGSDITINDGTVNAIGGQYAAGIGGGYYMGAASNITIGGGTVYAAGNFAAAIGVGFESDDPASNIMIVPAEGKQITVTAGNTDPLESIVGTFSSTTPYTRTDRYFHSYESFSNSSNCNIEESSVTITDNGNYNIYGTGKVTANSIILSSGVSPNITLANVNIINDYLTFVISDNSSGNVHINLVGNNSLQSRMYAGLIKNGSGVNVGTLTIEGSGSLRAVGGLDSAGIGATDGYSAGNIFINGGTIVAIGGDSAAGIGGGNSGSGSNININGGNVTATGGLFAAGIGGGDFASGYNININGGTVSASGGYGGAGIGGGYGGSVNIININGGNVTATGGSYAAGIGGGNGASGNNISIGGGIINAAGGVEATSIGAGTAGTAVPMMISPTAGKKITVMVGPAEPPTTVAGIFTSSTSYTAADRYLYAFEETIPVTYPVTVVNGTGGGDYAEGTTVNITADTAPAGKEFDQWTTADGVSFANAAESSTSFTMPAQAVTVTATYKDLPPVTYPVTVVNGTGSGDYAEGATVNITADTAPAGKEFDQWTTADGVSFANAAESSTSFTMPAQAVTVTATYKDLPPVTYPVTVVNGTGSGDYAEGATVNITADTAPAGKEFDQWTTADGVSFANAAESSTSFTMPAQAVTVTATYKDQTTTTYYAAPVNAPKIVDLILTDAGVPSNLTVGKGKNKKSINFTKEIAQNMSSKTDIMWNGEPVHQTIWVEVNGVQLEVMNPEYWEAILAYLNKLIDDNPWCGLDYFTYSYDDYCEDLQTP